MEDVAASEQSIPQGVLELIERNSDCVLRRMVSSFGVVGLVPSLENTKNKDLIPETHNVLQKARIPKYDPADSVQRALAEASKEAHEAAARSDEAHLREIEERVDTLAGELWSLTSTELLEIKRSLQRLGWRGDQK